MPKDIENLVQRAWEWKYRSLVVTKRKPSGAVVELADGTLIGAGSIEANHGFTEASGEFLALATALTTETGPVSLTIACEPSATQNHPCGSTLELLRQHAPDLPVVKSSSPTSHSSQSARDFLPSDRD